MPMIQAMSSQAKPTPKPTRRLSTKLTYRGIDLPKLTVPPRLPLADIKRAVAKAFAERDTAIADD
jgi:hypothetical protein